MGLGPTWAGRVIAVIPLFGLIYRVGDTSVEGQAQVTHLLSHLCLTLKLPGEGQMALPLNLNDKNIPNADFFLVF